MAVPAFLIAGIRWTLPGARPGDAAGVPVLDQRHAVDHRIADLRVPDQARF
jgi:hypothetical protein